jgi:hypothetical protein
MNERTTIFSSGRVDNIAILDPDNSPKKEKFHPRHQKSRENEKKKTREKEKGKIYHD